MKTPARHFALAIALLLPPLAATAKPAPPAFPAELAPLAGTWKRVKTQDKEKDTWVVIRNDAGKLRLKYSMPRKDKAYESDWDGRLEVELQVHIVEVHEPTLTPRPSPPGILMDEKITYKGTKGGETILHAVWEPGEGGKLLFRCLRIEQDKKDVACSSVSEFERVSADTAWPGR